MDAITGAPAVVNADIEIIDSDAGHDYKDSTFYIADGSALTPAEMRAALFAEMKADGCTDISLNGTTLKFTKGGVETTVSSCTWTQVYLVNAAIAVTGAGTDTALISASVAADTYVKAGDTFTVVIANSAALTTNTTVTLTGTGITTATKALTAAGLTAAGTTNVSVTVAAGCAADITVAAAVSNT